MKTQKRQVTITDLYNLVAHETVSLLEAVDDDAIPPALEMRKGLTMLAAAAGTGEGVETHLEWIDQEIENLKQTAGTPQCVTHLIPTSQLVRTVDIDAQIDMTLEFFHIVAETDEQETRTKLLELARTTTDMCGMGDCLFNCGDDAVEMMDQIWAAFLNSVYTRSGQNSTPNSNATNLHSSQKRCCSFCISSSNASPTFQVQKSIFHQMTKPIQVTVILPLLLAISFSRNDDIHSSISGISNDLIGVIPTIGQ